MKICLMKRDIEANPIYFLLSSHFGAKEVAETGLPLRVASAGYWEIRGKDVDVFVLFFDCAF